MSHAIDNAGDGSVTNPKVMLCSDNSKNSFSFREDIWFCVWAWACNPALPATICEFVVKHRFHGIVNNTRSIQSNLSLFIQRLLQPN